MEGNFLLDDLPRGVGDRKAYFDTTPAAKWAAPGEIAADPDLRFDPDNPGKKIFLGEVNGQLVGIDDDRHMITVAGSRAGKGVSALVPNLLTYRGSVLAIDPKGELACITAEHRAKGLGQKVHVLDPFGRLAGVPWAKDYRGAYNPLTILQGSGGRGGGKAVIPHGDKSLSETAVEDGPIRAKLQ